MNSKNNKIALPADNNRIFGVNKKCVHMPIRCCCRLAFFFFVLLGSNASSASDWFCVAAVVFFFLYAPGYYCDMMMAIDSG